MTFETSKTISGLGATLLFLAAPLFLLLPSATLIVGITGAIMLLIGLNGLANYYKERGILNNSLLGVLAAVVGAVVITIVALYVILSNITPLLQQIYPGWNGDWAALQNMTPDTSAFTADNIDISTFIPLLTGMIVVWALAWIVAIISGFFVRRSLKSIAEKSNIGLFGTAGMLILIGAFLGLVVFGYFLIWIGVLLAAIAFFQLRPSAPTVEPVVSPPPQTAI